MIVNTKGIVVKSTKFSETSLVVNIFTLDFGMQSYLVPGVRTSKAKMKSSFFQPLTLLDLVVYHRDNKNLKRIKEIKVNPLLHHIPFEMEKISVAMFKAELIYKSIKEEEKNEALFYFLSHMISFLDHLEVGLANFPIFFTLRLSKYLGFHPEANFSNNNPFFDLSEGRFGGSFKKNGYFLEMDLSDYLHQFMTADFSDFHEIRIPIDKRQDLLESLMKYYFFHNSGNFKINSIEILKQILRV